METTMNNLFKASLNKAVASENEKRNENARKLAEFLDDMKVIKKNLEDAFVGTPISVQMGMFGVPEPKYTTIRISSPYGFFQGITSNKAVYHCGSCSNWELEDKDIRVEGVPYTYEEFFNLIAKKFAQKM